MESNSQEQQGFIGRAFGFISRLFSEELIPFLNRIINSSIRFFKSVGESPEQAVPYAVDIIVAISGLVVFFYVLIKVASFLRKLGSWFKKVFLSHSDHAAKEVGNFLNLVISSAFSSKTYVAWIDWCAMLSEGTKARLRKNYENGDELIEKHRNLGLSVFLVSAWAGLAFFYAVYASSSSFKTYDPFVWWLILLGTPIYGLLILCFDRSIVAPSFLDNKRDGFRLWLSKGVGLFKLCIRAGVAYAVAHFTAIPLTILLLSGGILELQSKDYENHRATLVDHQGEAQTAYMAATKVRADSSACRDATDSYLSVLKQRDAESKNCRVGASPGECWGPKTEKLSGELLEAEDQRVFMCNLPEAQETVLTEAIDRAGKEVERLKEPSSRPDMLSGSIVLEKLKAEYAGSFFDPVMPTFWLLFIIELIPVLMTVLLGAQVVIPKGSAKNSR